MFIINRSENLATSLEKKTFSELKFKERAHLQEWIEKNPSILGEELLIIQKEFDGFDNTKERLDLLALDTDGNLVVIENKLDDTGKDVTWQALKYVSYCASLTKNEIRDIYNDYLCKYKGQANAEERLQNFFFGSDFDELSLNTGDQRIILVAANFRKEVTSTVMWLLDHGISAKCIKVTPYEYDSQIFLDTEQILPVLDTAELQIKIAQKKQEEYKTKTENKIRNSLRFQFWEKAIPRLTEQADIYHNVSPSNDNWIAGATGYGGFGYNCVIKQNCARAELYLGKNSVLENERVFDALFLQKDQIEKEIGHTLKWDKLEGKNACRISYEFPDFGLKDEDQWDKIIIFLGESIKKIKGAFSPRLDKIMKVHS